MQTQQAVRFDNEFEGLNKNYTLFQLPADLVQQIKRERLVQIIAPKINDDCHLVTSSNVFKLKKTIQQNSILVGEVNHNELLLKSNTQTIIVGQVFIPHYHEIYEFIQKFTLDNYEIDLAECYNQGQMFSLEDILKRFTISEEQLRNFLDKILCMRYKDKYYFFDEIVYVNLLRIIMIQLTEKNKEGKPFELQDLGFQDPLMVTFIRSTLKLYAPNEGQLDFLQIAKSVILELLYQKSEFIYDELYEAFFMILPTYYEYDINNLRSQPELLFHHAIKYLTILRDNNSYNRPIKDFGCYSVKYLIDQFIIITRKVVLDKVPLDSLDRIRYLSEYQQRFLFEEVIFWLQQANKTIKECQDFIQKYLKTTNEIVHQSNIEKIVKVYPFLQQDFQNVKNLKFYMLK